MSDLNYAPITQGGGHSYERLLMEPGNLWDLLFDKKVLNPIGQCDVVSSSKSMICNNQRMLET